MSVMQSTMMVVISRYRPFSSCVNKDLGLIAKDIGCKAKNLDFGLKDRGQGLTSLLSSSN